MSLSLRPPGTTRFEFSSYHGKGGGPRNILKVSELTVALRETIEQGFSEIWVEGEVTNLRIPQSGHCYFTLKDETTQIRAIRFRSYTLRRSPQFLPKEGDFVLIRGHLTVYEARGEYQIVIDYIEPRGIGALLAAFEALKERLRVEGLFDPIHKKQIPAFPKKIALITSPTGAVLQDFLRILLERETVITTLIVPVTVQGENAVSEISNAVCEINHYSRFCPVDLIVIARGGGSLEDLFAFNDEGMARTIFRSRIPVMTAIGHETDTTIADLVSDLRAPTPSVAAEIIARARATQIERFYQSTTQLNERMQEILVQYRRKLYMASRLLMAPSEGITHARNMVYQYFYRHQAAMARQLERYRSNVAMTTERLRSQSPIVQVAYARQKWERLSNRLHRLGAETITERKNDLANIIHQLNLLSPLNIMERGYSITEQRGKIVRDAADVAIDETIHVRLHRGKLLCIVKEKE